MTKLAKATSIFLDLHQLSPARPDAKLLGRVACHFAELPWENLTKFIKKHERRHESPIHVPTRVRGVAGAERLRFSTEVLDDHERLGTGGTCFSLTNALRRILTDLGFSACPAMADMRHGANVHCGLIVGTDGRRYLLDPGYLVAEPIPLDAGKPVRLTQTGSVLEYRPVGDGDEFALYTRNDRDEQIFRYRLRPGAVSETDFVRHWIESFDATGMNGLHLNRITGEGRLSAHDLNLRIDTGRDKRNVKLRDTYVDAIASRFDIDDSLVSRAFAEWESQRCRKR
jgi:arylamine N-acetyltransferase